MFALSLLVVLASPPLTLEDAVRQALRAHESPKIAQKAVEQAHAQYLGAFSRLLPNLSVSANITRRPGSTTVGGAVLQREESMAASGVARWRLVDLGAIPGIMAAHTLEEARELDALDVARTLAFATARQYFAVLAIEEILTAAQFRLEAAEAAVADASARVEAGVGRPADHTRAALEQQAAMLARRQAARDVELARLALATLMGEAEPQLALQPLVPPPPIGVPSTLVLRRPDILSLVQQREALSLIEWDNWASFLPSLNVQGYLNLTQEPGFAGRNVDWTVVFSLEWSLFQGGSRIARDFELNAQVDSLQLQIDQRRREAGLRIQEGRAELAAAQEALDIATLQEELARDNARQVKLLFEGGLNTALQQVDANAAVFQAQTDRARQALQVSLAELKILEEAGAWPPGGEGNGP